MNAIVAVGDAVVDGGCCVMLGGPGAIVSFVTTAVDEPRPVVDVRQTPMVFAPSASEPIRIGTDVTPGVTYAPCERIVPEQGASASSRIAYVPLSSALKFTFGPVELTSGGDTTACTVGVAVATPVATSAATPTRAAVTAATNARAGLSAASREVEAVRAGTRRRGIRIDT